MVQQKLYEAEAEVEAKYWEREFRVLLFMRSIRSSNLNDFSYNKRIDGQIRLKEKKLA